MQQRILIIMDMQPSGFPLSRVVTAQVLRETALAMRLGWKIAVVEFDIECTGPTDERIIDLLNAGGANWILIKKAAEDGSPEIVEALSQEPEKLDLNSAIFRMVGVTTDDCISKSAHGLPQLLANCTVEVVTDACTCWNIRYDWTKFSQSPRVTLVEPSARSADTSDSN